MTTTTTITTAAAAARGHGWFPWSDVSRQGGGGGGGWAMAQILHCLDYSLPVTYTHEHTK